MTTANLPAPLAGELIEQLPAPLLFMDDDGCVLGFNPAFRQLAGAAAEQLVGRCSAELDADSAGALLHGDGIICWRDEQGETRHLQIACFDIGTVGSIKVRLYTDISRQVELEQLRNSLNEQLSQSILTDRITGLLNQRGVMLALEPQVARSRRYNSPMAIIMMDLSGGADDERLRVQVAGLLKDQLRWADLVGCSGQHEFILVLPETTGEAALRLAEKLTRRVEEMAGPDNGSGSVNTCCGVTDWRRSDSAATLLGRAAQSLSQARSAHRPNPVAL